MFQRRKKQEMHRAHLVHLEQQSKATAANGRSNDPQSAEDREDSPAVTSPSHFVNPNSVYSSYDRTPAKGTGKYEFGSGKTLGPNSKPKPKTVRKPISPPKVDNTKPSSRDSSKEVKDAPPPKSILRKSNNNTKSSKNNTAEPNTIRKTDNPRENPQSGSKDNQISADKGNKVAPKGTLNPQKSTGKSSTGKKETKLEGKRRRLPPHEDRLEL